MTQEMSWVSLGGKTNKLEQNPAMKFFLSWSQFCTCSVPGFLGLNEKERPRSLLLFLEGQGLFDFVNSFLKIKI